MKVKEKIISIFTVSLVVLLITTNQAICEETSLDKNLETAQEERDPKESSFEEGSDFVWDKKSLIDFPPYKGELEFDYSKFTWEDSAKKFASGVMDIVPPSVRDMVAELILVACDETAEQLDEGLITEDVVAEALQKIAKGFGVLPPSMLKAVPQSPHDLEKPRQPVDAEQLK